MYNRESEIIRVSIIGIVSNVMLATFKFLIGLISNSIAIVLDAVNNLSDALSSIITIVGTKLALKQPDKKHPFGHGRIEYLTALIISILVIYAGITFLEESVKKIINPQTPNYSMFSLIIIMVAVIVKLILGMYVKKMGKKLNSGSLVNSGIDALTDAVISFTTLVSAMLFLFFKISLEAYLAVIISIVILKSGYEMIRETLSRILGERIDSDIAHNVKLTVNSFKEVRGTYDLMLNNYGPDTYLGSIHIEVSDTMKADEIDTLTRKITEKVLKQHNVILSAIGIYSFNTSDKQALKIRNDINKIVHSHKEVLQMHGFYFNKNENVIQFDLIIDYDIKHRNVIYNQICDEIKHYYPEYKFNIALDIDASD